MSWHAMGEITAKTAFTCGVTLRSFRNAMEEKFIRHCLSLTNGNVKRSAKLLEMSRTTLSFKLMQLGIEPNQYRQNTKRKDQD